MCRHCLIEVGCLGHVKGYCTCAFDAAAKLLSIVQGPTGHSHLNSRIAEYLDGRAADLEDFQQGWLICANE